MRTIKRDIVVALIYSKDGKLLMGWRDNKGGVYPECWHIPGGGVEEGESNEEAIIREIKEEVGLDLSGYTIEFVGNEDKGTAEKILKDTGEKVLVDMQFFLYKIVITDQLSSEITLQVSDEFTKTQWFTISELSTVKLAQPSEKYFRKVGYIK